MENIKQLLTSYHFSSKDEANLRDLAEILMPHSERLANVFHDYRLEMGSLTNPDSAKTEDKGSPS